LKNLLVIALLLLFGMFVATSKADHETPIQPDEQRPITAGKPQAV
jgi:hypothetical protein